MSTTPGRFNYFRNIEELHERQERPQVDRRMPHGPQNQELPSPIAVSLAGEVHLRHSTNDTLTTPNSAPVDIFNITFFDDDVATVQPGSSTCLASRFCDSPSSLNVAQEESNGLSEEERAMREERELASLAQWSNVGSITANSSAVPARASNVGSMFNPQADDVDEEDGDGDVEEQNSSDLDEASLVCGSDSCLKEMHGGPVCPPREEDPIVQAVVRRGYNEEIVNMVYDTYYRANGRFIHSAQELEMAVTGCQDGHRPSQCPQDGEEPPPQTGIPSTEHIPCDDCVCPVCEMNPSTVVAFPCHHLALCSGCSAIINYCPICNVHITSRKECYYCQKRRKWRGA